jgi:hypothetical protein
MPSKNEDPKYLSALATVRFAMLAGMIQSGGLHSPLEAERMVEDALASILAPDVRWAISFIVSRLDVL